MNSKGVKKAAIKAAFKQSLGWAKLFLDDSNQRIDGGLCVVALGV
jgi:hypothetical protein